MGIEAFAIGDVLFYHGSLLIELLLIPLASIPLILSTFVKDEVIRLKSDILTGLTFAITITVDEFAWAIYILVLLVPTPLIYSLTPLVM